MICSRCKVNQAKANRVDSKCQECIKQNDRNRSNKYNARHREFVNAKARLNYLLYPIRYASYRKKCYDKHKKNNPTGAAQRWQAWKDKNPGYNQIANTYELLENDIKYTTEIEYYLNDNELLLLETYSDYEMDASKTATSLRISVEEVIDMIEDIRQRVMLNEVSK